MYKSLAFFILIMCCSSVAFGKAKSHEIRFLSYNVWGMPFPIRPTHQKLRDAPKIIPKLKADIISMQEVFIKRSRDLAKMPEYPFTAYGLERKGIKLLPSGLLIASKFPIIKTDRMAFKACSGSDCLARKGALYARISIPELGEIDVFNVHMNAGKNKKTKTKQLVELKNFVDKHRSERPLFIMGDFNLEPDSIFYQDFDEQFFARDSHFEYLQQNPDAPKEEREGYTYKLTIGPIKIRQKLDYIWYQDGVAKPIELLDYKVVFDGKNGLPKLSDHFGITGHFEIKNDNKSKSSSGTSHKY